MIIDNTTTFTNSIVNHKTKDKIMDYGNWAEKAYHLGGVIVPS